MPTSQQIKEQQIVDRLLARYERRYSGKIRGLRNKVIQQSVDLFEKEGIVYTPENLEAYKLQLVELSKQNSSKVIPAFSSRTARKLKTQITDIDRIDNAGFHTFLKEDWVNEFALQKSKLAAETTYYELQNVVRNGVRQELTRDTIIKNLLDVQKLSKFRAITIARTETHQAAMFSSQKTAEAIDRESEKTVYKTWVPVQDGRTRDTHSAMASHPSIPVTGLFRVGVDNLERPGDPNGSAEEVINCRCVLSYSLK